MRYSMLVYITNMSKTLLEAARYLRTAESGPLRKEMLGSGRQMLSQIRAVLNRYQKDLRSEWPAERLAAVEGQWEGQGAELEPLLEEFCQRLPQEVHYQVRAVFFAELGQKWDSMESAYEAMRDDPRFDTVVVLTPVFREVKQQTGKTVREVICKDYLTPMGIPFIPHDQYSLKEDCPELAFISQPYESCTLKEFWPSNIAQYARLVYTQYSIPGPAFVGSIKARCQLPVYRYAWKVLGQSERHYRFYRQYAMNGGANMLVSGLPKSDPIVRIRDGGKEHPKSWEPVLQGRTVLLWNTWYDVHSSSISFFDSLVEWLRNNDDYAVIWRAHPMTNTVTKLYHSPEMYSQLQQRIATARALPNMIYDEQSSFTVAFSCVDALISDYSSLMFQFLLLDKPVLWIKQKGKCGPYGDQILEGESIVDWHWIEEAHQFEEVIQFAQRIRQGEDKKADMRKTVLQHDLSLADGHCGERVRDMLWTMMHQEDGLIDKNDSE